MSFGHPSSINTVDLLPTLVTTASNMGNRSSSTSSTSSSMVHRPGPSHHENHRGSSPDTHTKCYEVQDLSPEGKRQLLDIMKDGKNRLRSFRINKWSKSDVSILKLAEAGFYFEPESRDRVVCPFCFISVEDWSSQHEPIHEHYRHNPRCRFIAGYDVGNIPVSDDPVRGQSRLLDYDVAGPYSSSLESHSAGTPTPSSSQSSGQSASSSVQSHSNPSSVLDREHRAPKHRSMIQTDLRLKTYPEDWSSFCPVPPIPLAEAGFFHCGPVNLPNGEVKKDAVNCFHCGSLLYDWEANDDPWYEHKRVAQENNIKCVYLRLNWGSASSSGSAYSGSAYSGSASSGSDDESELTITVPSQAMEIESPDRIRCKVCLHGDAIVLFEDCGHLATCPPCAASLTHCPLCRTEIKESRKVFL